MVFLDVLGVLGDLLSRFSTWRLIGHGVLCSYLRDRDYSDNSDYRNDRGCVI